MSTDSESSESNSNNSYEIKKVTFKFEDYIEFCNNYYDSNYVEDE